MSKEEELKWSGTVIGSGMSNSGRQKMSKEEELKWVTKRFSWRYIPLRYQAMVATVVSALLYFNIFQMFTENAFNGGACGFFFLPGTGDTTEGYCPRTVTNFWFEFVCTIIGLAICGWVMRRAIKRENATN